MRKEDTMKLEEILKINLLSLKVAYGEKFEELTEEQKKAVALKLLYDVCESRPEIMKELACSVLREIEAA